MNKNIRTKNIAKIKTIIFFIIFIIFIFPFMILFNFLRNLIIPKKEIKFSDNTFNIETFKKLSFNEKKDYCRTYLKYISEGASREVYRLDKNKVLKLSKKRSSTQNKSEILVTKIAPELFPKIFESDEKNYEWIISEYAAPAKEEDFEKYFGANFTQIKNFIWYNAPWYSKNRYFRKKQYKRKELTFINNIPFFKKLKETKCRILDMSKLNAWGVINGKMILVDSGLLWNKQLKHDKNLHSTL